MTFRYRDVLYGPVLSRRLGCSLGVNLLPLAHKVCSFDCIYCEHGLTDQLTLHPQSVEFPSVEHVLEAVDAGLRTYPKLDHLTLSGNGEPTLHPDFLEIARGIRALRDRLQPGLHIAVFSNATTVTQPEIRKALTFFNDPILKLDAGDEATWRAINRPPLGITLAEIVDSLPLVPNLVLQSLFLDGRTQNVRGEPYQAWLRAVKKVQPMLVQVYSVDRPTPECGVVEVPAEGLERIAREITASTGILAHAY